MNINLRAIVFGGLVAAATVLTIDTVVAAENTAPEVIRLEGIEVVAHRDVVQLEGIVVTAHKSR